VDLVIANSANVGAVRARNQGLAASAADYVLFSDNDIEFATDIVGRLLAVAESDPRIGIVGPLLNQQLDELGMPEGLSLPAITQRVEIERAGQRATGTCVPSCCALFRRSLLDAVGPWDTAYDTYAYEDFDYCQQAKARGFGVVVALDCYVHHRQNATIGQLGNVSDVVRRNRALFLDRWGVPVGDSVGIVEPGRLPIDMAPSPAADSPATALAAYVKLLQLSAPVLTAEERETLRRRWETLLRRLPDPGRDVLVLGRGGGHAVRLLRHLYGRHAIGVVPRLRDEAPYAVWEGEPFAIPLPDVSLDGVVAWRSLEYSAMPLLALLEINRVLRPDGRALVLVPPAEATSIARPGCYSVLGDAHWRRLFADTGLRVTETREEVLDDERLTR
jgi:hypothetical protein